MPVRLDQIGPDGSIVEQKQQSQAPTGGTLPPEVEAIVSQMQNRPGMRIPYGAKGSINIPASSQNPREQLLQRMAEKKIDAMNQATTESERASTRIAQTGLEHVARIKKLLDVGGTEDKPTVGNYKPITPSVNSPLPYDPSIIRNPTVHDPKKIQMRDDIESAISLLALLRTGKAGETAQIKNIRSNRTIGEREEWFRDAKTISRRLGDLEREFNQYASGKVESPVDKKKGDPLGIR